MLPPFFEYFLLTTTLGRRRVILILAALAISCVQTSGVAAAQASKDSKVKGKAAARTQLASVCQPPGVTPVQSSQTTLSSHTVTLSWNASVPSSGHGTAEGYCLYRSQKQGDAHLEKDCKECELLNQTPLHGTSCIDATVTNGTTYYYAVAAVNGGGMSGPSNEAPAPIRADQPAGSPPQGIALCNGTNPADKSDKTSKK
jgi:hypothetical protein